MTHNANHPELSPDGEVWARVSESSDPDSHAQSQVQWDLRYQQMSRGEFHAWLHQAQLPGLRLVQETANVALHIEGQFPEGTFGFAVLLTEDRSAIFNGQRVGANTVMTGRGDDIDLSTEPAFGLAGIVVDDALLAPLWQRMYDKPRPPWLDAQLVHQVHAENLLVLRRLHRQALEVTATQFPREASAFTLRRLRDELLIEWIEALPAQVDASVLPQLAQRRKIVSRARARALAHLDEPMSMLELCCEVGVSRRKLNYCFQDVLGMSPVQYLRALRLNGVRRELLRGGAVVTVQDVAARWGFWHLSQFSADYKQIFSELPSATLRQAQAG